MCLGLPGEVVEWLERDPLFARAEIRFGGVRKVCHMACVPEAEVGDYVIVHAGIAICRVQPDQVTGPSSDVASEPMAGEEGGS